jgi:hypothetical protein
VAALVQGAEIQATARALGKFQVNAVAMLEEPLLRAAPGAEDQGGTTEVAELRWMELAPAAMDGARRRTVRLPQSHSCGLARHCGMVTTRHWHATLCGYRVRKSFHGCSEI